VQGWVGKKTSLCIVGVTLLGMLLGLACIPSESAFDKAVVVALDMEVKDLDPYTNNQKADAIIDWLVHDQLFFRDPKTLRPVPNLAESLKPVDDVTWDLKLRPHIRFHNGEPVDAKAVKFSFERILQPDLKSPYRATFSWLKDVELTNDLALRLHAHRPVPSLPDVLTRVHVLPPRYLQEAGDAHFRESPVGAGPYRLLSWKKGGGLVIKANDEYWGGPKGRPSLRTITFQVILDSADRLAKLLTGTVHIARGLTAEQALLLEHSGIARVSAKPTPRVVFLQMDGDGRAGKTPLTERRVRRAINYALPVDEIIDTALGKFAVRAPAGLTPLHFGYDPAIQPRPFDLQKARALLSEAGYNGGLEIPFNMSPPLIPGAERLGALMMESLEKVGIKLRLRRFTDIQEFHANLRLGKLEGLTLLAWGDGASFDADAMYYPFFHTGQPQAYNTSPELDKLLDDARSAVDPERRKAIYSALQKLIVDQGYWVSLYGQYTIEGVNRKLEYVASSDELMHLFSATWKEYN